MRAEHKKIRALRSAASGKLQILDKSMHQENKAERLVLCAIPAEEVRFR
jgi:hypothetical protein